MDRGDVAETIWDMIHDEYYSTHKVEDTKAWLSYGLKTDKDKGFHSKQEVLARMQEFYERFKSKFVRQQGGYVFGSIATIANEATGSFVTTSRGKTEADVSEENLVYVHHINHAEREILIDSIRNRKGLSVKASLNAPLVHGIFHYLPEAHTVVHLHEQREELQTFPYAPPGTVRDGYNSRRTSGERKSFNVKNHGCYLIFNKIGEQI
jgi:ribulose-5-phosphate 4-epimerase/fuculose-1-phosphate aldolase